MPITKLNRTPGDWFVGKDLTIGPADNRNSGVGVVVAANNQGHAEADAHLMAAAPQLFEALEEVMDSLGALTDPYELFGFGMTEDDINRVLLALRKAKGEA